MAITRATAKELSLVQNLQTLTVVYEEIAVMRINTTKNSVLITRNFVSKLSTVFYNIKLSYKNQLLALLEGKKKVDPLLIANSQKNGKEVHVLLSANNRMYGDIINQVFNTFYENTEKGNADVVILGNVGKALYKERAPGKPFTYFDVSDTKFEIEEVRPVMQFLLQYEKVYIYYGKFVSVLNQQADIADISGDKPFELQEHVAPEEKEQFLFEPNIPHILNVFEMQIFYALFKQTLHEIELARYASRIQAMEKTNENINIRIKHLIRKEKRIKNLEANKRQLQQLAHVKFFKQKRMQYAKG